MRSIIKKIFLLALLLITSNVFGEDFLPPEQAFKAVATWNIKSAGADIAITIAPTAGYYVYRESIKLRINQPNTNDAIALILPKGKTKFDENFGKKLEIYPSPFLATAIYSQANMSNMTLEVELQGCADKGICYPPMKMRFKLLAPNELIDGVLVDELADTLPATNRSTGLSDLWGARDDAGLLATLLKTISPIIFGGGFFCFRFGDGINPLCVAYVAYYVECCVRCKNRRT